MNQITLPEITNIQAVPSHDLRRALAQAIGITAKTLAYLAEIWRELERRGEDLSDLRSGLMLYLPLVASGRLEPELVVRCAGQTMLLRAASELPLDQQRELLRTGAQIATTDADRQSVVVHKPLERLSAAEVRRLFSMGRVRAAQEQMQMLAPVTGSRASKSVAITVTITQAEYEELKSRATARGKKTPTFVREILRGVLKNA